MSQHDYVIGNDTGAAVRADINDALSAIVSNNSGAAAPSATFAYQLWADTTNGLLKIRNAANSAWITIGTLAATNLGLLSLGGGTMTGAILNAVGAVGAPSYSFTGDTDTGFYWISANKFAAVVNGVAVMTFDASTYTQINGTGALLVPIGTTAQRPTGTNGLIRYNSDNSVVEAFQAGAWSSLGATSSGLAIASKSSNYTFTNSDDVLLVTGTTTITCRAVSGATSKPFYVKNMGTGVVTVAAAGADTFDSNGVTAMYLLTPDTSITIIPDGTSKWINV